MRKPSSIVVNFDAEKAELTFHTVEDSRLEPILPRMAYPILLSDFGGRIDDEFARRFGVAILSSLALFKPGLAELMDVTFQEMPDLDRKPPDAP
jgi:hypothetical protein